MIKVHCIILIICSIIGFTGHYCQFGIMRLTPWIPATIGVTTLLLQYRFSKHQGWIEYLPLLLILGFGIITTRMCIKFLPQDFQPLRKKIDFSIMSLSAWLTVAYSIRKMPKMNRK